MPDQEILHQRDIADDFKYDPELLPILEELVGLTENSLKTVLGLLTKFSLIRPTQFSPDGLLGGKGFILPIKQIKQALGQSVTDLTDIYDTLVDETRNPRWTQQPPEEEESVEDEDEMFDDVPIVKEYSDIGGH